jgi:DNA-binding SARP family transcriptional activator
LELVARASLELGGSELATAERAARTLVERAPYRETGYRALMEALAAAENSAEALRVYEELRCRLRDDLGATPGQATQALHRKLLA